MGGHLIKTYKGHSMTSMEISKKCTPILVYKLMLFLGGQPKKSKNSFNEKVYERLILAALIQYPPKEKEKQKETLVYLIKNRVYFLHCTYKL